MAPKSATKLGQTTDVKPDKLANARRADFNFHDDGLRDAARTRAEPPQATSARSWPISYRGIAGWVAAFDVLLIVGMGLLSEALYHQLVLGGPSHLRQAAAIGAFVAVIFVAITQHHKLYRPSQLILWNVQLNNVVWIWCATFFLLSGFLFVWKASEDVSRGAILSYGGFGLLALLSHRLFWRSFLKRALKKGSLRGRKVIVIARSSAIDPAFAGYLGRYGYEIVREFVIRGSSAEEMNSDLARAIAFVRGSPIEEVLLFVKGDDLPKLAPIVDRLRVLPLPVTWVANGVTAELVRQPWSEIGPAVAVEMQRPPRSKSQRALKRIFDVVGASCGLMLLSPLLMIVALAIKLDSPGPVFFLQTRRGFNGKTFKIFKFRSMSISEDGKLIKQATKNDPRVTPVGAWIRKTSIDEIPQLFNVLRGEMSLVGPRPHAIAHDDKFIEMVENYAYRHHVKPGITGWAQVHGFRGETPTLEAIQRRVEFDRWYINNWSIWLDFLIMLRTLGKLVRDPYAY